MNDQPHENLKISARNVYKIFGKDVDAARQLLSEGLGREEILERTGCVTAVNDVSFDVKKGETFVVMGLSGSGKSTLIRCVNKLIPATSGSILVDGEDIGNVTPQRLRQIRQSQFGMVFQHFALLPHKSVLSNTTYGLKVQGVERGERRAAARQALEEVGLAGWEGVKPSSLSGGMKQRVGIARALALNAEVMLMDEPFSALDPLIRRDMQEMMVNLQQRYKKTMVFITHDLHEALKLGDQIAIMKEGRFVQVGTPEEIVAKPKTKYVADFLKDVDRARVLKARTLMRRQPPLPETATAGEALNMAEQIGASGLYVTDSDRKPIGAISRSDIEGAADQGNAPVSTFMDRDVNTAPHDTLLVDLFSYCRADRPIAIVDGEEKLIGVVKPFELFAYLADLEEERASAA